MSTTNIEWTTGPNGEKGRVWNPVTGCTKVSQGCRNCYAEGVAKRFWAKQYPMVTERALSPRGFQGTVVQSRPRRFTDVQTHADRLLEPLKWRKPARIFVNSMSDLFHEDVPFEFIDHVFAVMALATEHTFLVLTKRPERMRDYLAAEGRSLGVWNTAWNICDWTPEPLKNSREAVTAVARYRDPQHAEAWPLPNVHLGVSVENQQTADERIPLLLQTPAAIRWVSYEPALGPVSFEKFLNVEGPEVECCGDEGCEYCDGTGTSGTDVGLNWIVVGGESGRGARPFDIAWARSTVDQCVIADVACFVKQLGADPVLATPCAPGWKGMRVTAASGGTSIVLRDRKGGDPNEWPEDLRVRELPGSETLVQMKGSR